MRLTLGIYFYIQLQKRVCEKGNRVIQDLNLIPGSRNECKSITPYWKEREIMKSLQTVDTDFTIKIFSSKNPIKGVINKFKMGDTSLFLKWLNKHTH